MSVTYKTKASKGLIFGIPFFPSPRYHPPGNLCGTTRLQVSIESFLIVKANVTGGSRGPLTHNFLERTARFPFLSLGLGKDTDICISAGEDSRFVISPCNIKGAVPAAISGHPQNSPPQISYQSYRLFLKNTRAFGNIQAFPATLSTARRSLDFLESSMFLKKKSKRQRERGGAKAVSNIRGTQ